MTDTPNAPLSDWSRFLGLMRTMRTDTRDPDNEVITFETHDRVYITLRNPDTTMPFFEQLIERMLAGDIRLEASVVHIERHPEDAEFVEE